MVNQTFRKNARIHSIVALGVITLALLVPTPVFADSDPAQPELPEVDVYEMPMPVPSLPSPVQGIQRSDLPEIADSLPMVSEDLPTQLPAIQAAATTADNVLTRSEDRLDSTLQAATRQMNATRTLVDRMRARVGSPAGDDILVKARSAGGSIISYTAYDMATTMQASIYTSTAYLRGLSNLGPTGLNLTFIILGLGWIGVVNLIEFSVRISAFMITIFGSLIKWAITLITVLIDVINALGTWLDAIIPG